MKTKKKPAKSDWRSLPRKAAIAKRTEQMVFKFTPAEASAIRAAARAADQTLIDYVVSRCARIGGDEHGRL